MVNFFQAAERERLKQEQELAAKLEHERKEKKQQQAEKDRLEHEQREKLRYAVETLHCFIIGKPV